MYNVMLIKTSIFYEVFVTLVNGFQVIFFSLELYVVFMLLVLPRCSRQSVISVPVAAVQQRCSENMCQLQGFVHGGEGRVT